MFPELKNKALHKRAELYAKIRDFFAKRQVLEVETPLLGNYGVTDRYIENITANYADKIYFLQTSPEYAMKRLLAEGSGSIFQICKAFRHDESGKNHNPEFTLLEWYRLGFTQQQLMDEMDELLQLVLTCQKAVRYTYQEIFQKFVKLDPFTATLTELTELLSLNNKAISKDEALQLVLSNHIEPQLSQLAFIYNFPASQAALARLSPTNPTVAERFEVYFAGLELANGFRELTDAKQQLQRFEADQHYRATHNLPAREIDPNFISALKQGLPECSGVALGLDRVLMLMLGADKIENVLSFTWASQ